MKDKEIKNTITGILVLILVYAHVPAVLELLNIPFYESKASVLYLPRFYFFNSFYLTCFFVLEGMYSLFDKPIKEQLILDIKRFFLPCIIVGFFAEIVKSGTLDLPTIKSYLQHFFLFGPGDYFIVYMLLFTRLFYKLSLFIKNNTVRLVVLLGFSFLGCIINNLVSGQFRYWEQVLILVPFIEFGRIFKDKLYNIWRIIVVFILYCALCSIFVHLQTKLPYIHDGGRLSVKLWPVYVIMGTFGSISLIALCRHFNSRALRYIGKNFLGYILVHISILIIIIRLFYNQIISSLNCFLPACIMVCSLFIITLLISTGFVFLFNKKPLKSILGTIED